MSMKDYRKVARLNLKGHWKTAIALCFVYAILGIVLEAATALVSIVAEMDLVSDSWLSLLSIVSLIATVGSMAVSGALALGKARYFTNLASDQPGQLMDLFSRFPIFAKAVWMQFVINFFVGLWSLVGILPASFIVTPALMNLSYDGAMIIMLIVMLFASFPGWMASYRYAMVPYLIAEFPDLPVMDAMRESKRLMEGNKWELFRLNLSFFGWTLLSIIGLGIGFLWLTPYMSAANAVFYMKVTGRGPIPPSMQPEQ